MRSTHVLRTQHADTSAPWHTEHAQRWWQRMLHNENPFGEYEELLVIFKRAHNRPDRLAAMRADG